jgi:glutamate dehydrogenase
VRSGRLAAADRHELLFASADEACQRVLAHNRSQVLAVSLDELRSRRDPDLFMRSVESLCEYNQLDPAELGLPGAVAVSERAGQGVGLTRPELAVLLGLAKLHVLAELGKSDLPLSDYVDPVYRLYFPVRFREELPDALAGHRLRREIGALGLVNRLVDAGGATLFSALTTELGVGVPEAVGAMLQAEDVLRIPDYRARLLERLDTSRDGVYRALVEVDAGVRDAARYLLRGGVHEPDVERVERWRSGLDALRSAMGDYLSEGDTQRFAASRERIERRGLPPDLAFEISGLALADRGLNILRICERAPVEPVDAARAYARLGEETGINWVYERLSQADVASPWDRMVLVDVRGELLDLQREITEGVLERKPDDLAAAVDDFVADHAAVLERVRGLQRRAAAAVSPSALAVITERLRSLCP